MRGTHGPKAERALSSTPKEVIHCPKHALIVHASRQQNKGSQLHRMTCPALFKGRTQILVDDTSNLLDPPVATHGLLAVAFPCGPSEKERGGQEGRLHAEPRKHNEPRKNALSSSFLRDPQAMPAYKVITRMQRCTVQITLP